MQWFAPLVADAEAGFGGNLNAFELMKAMIEAGAACVHFEDQLSSAKKCGHLGGKVLVPTAEAIQKLVAARLAADVLGRADADHGAHRRRQRAPADQRHRSARPRVPHRRAHGGRLLRHSRRPRFGHRARPCLRALCRPDLVRNFGARIWKKRAASPKPCTRSIPGKLLAYNCSPSFNWKKKLDDATIAALPDRAGGDGLQVPVHYAGRLPRAEPEHVRTGAGIQRLGHDRLLAACRRRSSAARRYGYEAVKHQRFVGTGYFDMVTQVIASGTSSTTALAGSTEAEQFAARRVRQTCSDQRPSRDSCVIVGELQFGD